LSALDYVNKLVCVRTSVPDSNHSLCTHMHHRSSHVYLHRCRLKQSSPPRRFSLLTCCPTESYPTCHTCFGLATATAMYRRDD